jgi:hypothetical protein
VQYDGQIPSPVDLDLGSSLDRHGHLSIGIPTKSDAIIGHVHPSGESSSLHIQGGSAGVSPVPQRYIHPSGLLTPLHIHEYY